MGMFVFVYVFVFGEVSFTELLPLTDGLLAPGLGQALLHLWARPLVRPVAPLGRGGLMGT